MNADRDFSTLDRLTGRDRTDFKRTVVKPCLDSIALHGSDAAHIAQVLAAMLPHLEPDERAEVLAAILARGEYYPFLDGRQMSDVVKDGFVLNAKSVQYRF